MIENAGPNKFNCTENVNRKAEIIRNGDSNLVNKEDLTKVQSENEVKKNVGLAEAVKSKS